MGREKCNYAQVIDIYNKSGSAAAAELLTKSYGIKYPRNLIYRLKNTPEYMYDRSADKFAISAPVDTGKIFMGLDELCMTDSPSSLQPSRNASGDVPQIKDLIQQLLVERLLELNAYVTIDHINKVATIRRSALVSMGYTVLTN
jgi:hypothetical protein